MRALALGGLLLGFAMGCGGSSAAEVPGSSVPGTDPGTEPGAPTGPASSSTSSSGGTSSGSPTPTPTPPAQPKDRRIDPIEVGRAWTFEVKVLGIYPLCENGTFEANAVRAETVEGKQAIYVTSFCPSSPGFHYSVDGDNVWSHYLGEWISSLQAPVQKGHSWTDGYLDYEWESKGTVTVPAGTFDECWSATTIASYTSYILLCRGVGPVRWHYEDGWGNGYDATLVAKNF
jgi:hypothetical protein